MKLINLTPHTISLLDVETNSMFKVPPSGTVARVSDYREQIGILSTECGVVIPVNRVKYGEVVGLPEPTVGIYYIVSSIVAQAVPHRADVLIVDKTIRDNQGRIIGASALAHV